MSIDLKKIQLPPGVKAEAGREDQITDCIDQRLHSFSFEPKAAVKSGITIRPIQSGLGIIGSLGRLSMVNNTAGKQVVGIPTGMNIASGTLDALLAAKRQSRAEQMGDNKEASVEKVNKLEACINAVSGFAAAFFCFAQIKCQTEKLSSNTLSVVSVAGKVAAFTGLIEDVGFGISSALGAGISAYRFYETYRFRNSFEAAEKGLDRDGLHFLVDQLRVNSSAQLKTIRAGWEAITSPLEKEAAIGAYKTDLEEKALDALSEKGLFVTEDKQLSPSEARVKFFQYFEDLKRRPAFELQLREAYADCMKLTLEECSDFSLAALVGFFVEKSRQALRQEAKMIRCTSSSVVEAVQRAASRGLQERLRAGGPVAKEAQREYKALSNTVNETLAANQSANMKSIAESVVTLAICVIGILSFCGLCAAPPLFLLLLLVALTIVANKGSIERALREGPIGKHDKHYLLLISAVLFISFATGLGLYLGLHLAGIELVKLLVIGIVEVLLTAYAFYALDKRDQAWKESHPDLEQFKEKITDLPLGPLTDEVSTLFNRLSEEDQLAVREAYETRTLQSDRYRQIDQSYRFGSYFLEQNFASPKEMALFQSGIEKTLEQCWSAHQENQTQEQLEIALKMQRLFEAISRREKKASLQALNELYQHAEALFQISENVRYEYKKEESVEQLLTVIKSILSSRAQENVI